MKDFISQHKDLIYGVLHGFDRLIFKGNFLGLNYLDGIEAWMATHRILYKDFTNLAQSLSDRIKKYAQDLAEDSGCPLLYLNNPKESKKDIAEGIIAKGNLKSGLVCVLSCVEQCHTFGINRDKASKHIVLRSQTRKCLHYYFYYLDPYFGLIHIRLQTWFPFTIQVYLNGREYVAKRLSKRAMKFTKKHNCFTYVEDLAFTQQCFKELETRRWERVLNRFAQRVNPLLQTKFISRAYYWTVGEAEYATDVIFKDSAALAQLYPKLAHYAIEFFHCPDVLMFLGRGSPSRFRGDLNGQLIHRPEGVCVKFRINENSIKMYDKELFVLRVETTINNPRRFKVWRSTKRGLPRAWVPMRRGIADLKRRVEISRAANERYLQALAVVSMPAPAKKVLQPLTVRASLKNQPVRALNPISAHETELFEVAIDGAFVVEGFRNKDVLRRLFPNIPPDKKLGAVITRKLRLLRAHGLIMKVSKTNRYRPTRSGLRAMTATLLLTNSDLMKIAA